MIWYVSVRFTWGKNVFSFPMEHEARAFQSAVLLCRECLLASIQKGEGL